MYLHERETSAGDDAEGRKISVLRGYVMQWMSCK